ncbi:MAG: RHS repeat-associated core domain-containing protein [Coprothermobacterota bacterium]|nr:RHS repeat-associated core domain-containing protein [Coprothermobacterota bacterium]
MTVGSYSYNGMGKRVSKVAGTVNSTYLWDGENLAQETRGGTNYLYSYFGMNPIALTSGNSSQVLEIDLPGSVLGVVNSSGVEIARYITDDFGNLQNQGGNSPNPFLFAGSFFDCESGLYQMRGRYYDPLMGRFLTQDFGPGNPYSYCKNNPVSMVDPSGWWAEATQRFRVDGGPGTFYELLKYLCGPATDAYVYCLNLPNEKKLDLLSLIGGGPPSGEQIARLAEFFKGVDISYWKGTHGEEAFTCIDFVNLILRLSSAVEPEFNPGPDAGWIVYNSRFLRAGDNAQKGLIAIFFFPNGLLHAGIQVDLFTYIGINPKTGGLDKWGINVTNNRFPILFIPWLRTY